MSEHQDVLRSLPLVALCALIGYTAVSLAPCAEGLTGDPAARASRHAEHGSAQADPHAAHRNVDQSAHGDQSAHAGRVAHHDPPEPAPCEIGSVCPCGCESGPDVARGSARIPAGIAAAVPALPRAPECAPFPSALPTLASTPSGAIEHVPIFA